MSWPVGVAGVRHHLPGPILTQSVGGPEGVGANASGHPIELPLAKESTDFAVTQLPLRTREILRDPRRGLQHREERPSPADLTVIVPAFNEEETVADTIRSLQSQTLPPAEIIVVDDCSADQTAEVARSCGVRVVRPPSNTGI